MKNIYKFVLLSVVCVAALLTSASVSAQQTLTANAGPDLYLTAGQTSILQGYGYDQNGYALNYYWNCNGGTLSSYNIAQPNYTAPYNYNNYNYNNQVIYTCTLTVTNNYGGSNSDSMTVYINYGSGYYGNGFLTVSKKVINLTYNNLNWQTGVNANPSDILTFAITLQANNQDVHNVVVRDVLPANLTYRGNLTVNTGYNYSGNITSGLNIGTVYRNQPVVVAYQAQVAPYGNFNYGATTLTNNATITSTESGNQAVSAMVVVNRSSIYGASTINNPTYVSTGLTNNFFTDSFLLPLLIIVLGLWLYFSGKIYIFADMLKK